MVAKKVFFFIIAFSSISPGLKAEENLCIFHEGVVVYEISTNKVDSIAIDTAKLFFYNDKKELLYSVPQQYVDSICFLDAVPQADLLDVKFNTDGSAEDISPMKNTIQKIGTPWVYQSSQQNRYVSQFRNPWGGDATDYYKISYADNQAFMDGLADGHSLETIVRGNYGETLADKEAKWFSSHQSGGTGFLISKTDASIGRRNEITFLPYVGGAWKWVTSGVVPENDVYYHLIGVWNKEEGKAYIYVNGELKNVIDTQGDFKHAKNTCYYFSIGADPSNATKANTAWAGDIAVARIYNTPLTQEQVTSLWKRASELQGKKEKKLITNVQSFSNLKVKVGGKYHIYGKGFIEGDSITFTDENESKHTYTLDVVLDSTCGIKVILPQNIVSGTYKMTLIRGDVKQFLGVTILQVIEEMPHGGRVVAHRGFWDTEGASQNSRKSLQNALDMNCYASETDVWLTKDGHIVVNHDATLNGTTIQTATYNDIKDLKLDNGETIPELKDFLEILAKSTSSTKLIIEIKSHSTVERTCEAVDSVVALVKKLNLQEKIEYIAFNFEVCKKVVSLDSSAVVGYLNGDKSPLQLYNAGIKVMDYTPKKMTDIYIEQAHKLGMMANVWTVDAEADIITENNRNVDFITTNAPILACKIFRHYKYNR